MGAPNTAMAPAGGAPSGKAGTSSMLKDMGQSMGKNMPQMGDIPADANPGPPHGANDILQQFMADYLMGARKKDY